MEQTKKEQEIIDNLKTMYNNGYIDKEFQTIIDEADKIIIVKSINKIPLINIMLRIATTMLKKYGFYTYNMNKFKTLLILNK